MCSRELERELIKKAQSDLHSKIDRGEFNGDVQDQTLLVLLSVHRGVKKCTTNPMVQIGEVFRDHPKLIAPVALVAWVLIGASALAVVFGFFQALGIQFP